MAFISLLFQKNGAKHSYTTKVFQKESEAINKMKKH